MSAPRVSRRVAVEARFTTIDEALAFVHEQLTALALPEPAVSITPMVTEGNAFRRVHFIAVVKGTEATPPPPPQRCEAWVQVKENEVATCYLDSHSVDEDHRAATSHNLSLDWAWSDARPVPQLVRRGAPT